MRRRPMREMNAFRARLEETRVEELTVDLHCCAPFRTCASVSADASAHPACISDVVSHMIEIANFIQDLDGLKSPSSALRSRAQGPERRSLPRRRGETGFCQRHQQFDRAVITRRCLLPELLEHGLHSS